MRHVSSAQGVQTFYDFGGADNALKGLGGSSDPSLTNWAWSEKHSDLAYVGSQYAHSMRPQATDNGDGTGVIDLWFYQNADLEGLLSSSSGSLGTLYFDPSVFSLSDFEGGIVTGANAFHHTNQWDIADSVSLEGSPSSSLHT